MLPVPLLDRPSAVGDEGRPRVTSLTVASFAVAALVGVTGYLVGQPDLLPSLGTVAGLTAIGVALLDRERFVHLLVGHAFLTWFGVLLAGLVVVGPFATDVGLVAAAYAIALFGLAVTWSDAGDAASMRRVVNATGRTYAAVWLWLIAIAVVAFFASLVASFVGVVTGVQRPLAATMAFVAVLVGSAAAVHLSLRWLPIRQLTPRSRRPVVETYLSRFRRLVFGSVAVGLFLGFVVVGLHVVGSFDRLVTGAPVVVLVLRSLTSWFVVGPLVAFAGTCLGLGVLAWIARWVAERSDPVSARRLSAAIAALPLATITIVGFGLLLRDDVLGIPLLLYALVGPTTLLLIVICGLFVASLGLVPDRAGGPALAAGGLVLAALGPLPPVLAFASVATGLLVWDVSTFGLGVTAELGHRPETRRLELVHGLLSVGVAAVVVLLATGLYGFGQSAVAGGTTALLVAGIGALLLLVPLRG